MAVVLLQEHAALLDHEAWLLQQVGRDKDNHHKRRKFTFQGLFDIKTPFLMDGEAQKIAEKLDGREEEIQKPKRKKKKELHVEDNLESATEAKYVLDTYAALRLTPEFKILYDYIPTSEDYRSNNVTLRNLRTRVLELSNIPLPNIDEVHEGPGVGTKLIHGAEYTLPPHVHYICDDVSNIMSYLSDEKFDFIVMDPPWQNKHVRRKKLAKRSEEAYQMMSVKDILKIPIKNFLKDGSLLAVWSTNKQSQIQEFLDGLHTWDVEHVATWYWLKVTKAGEPVTPLTGSGHTKLPYERIFLARRKTLEVCRETIPKDLVFCSVPSGIHSHKPPLLDLMKKFMVSEPRCLELFARNLISGWTSFGLEVLRLQHKCLFGDLEDAS